MLNILLVLTALLAVSFLANIWRKLDNFGMAWGGQLNTNEVFASLFNMIISTQVFGTGVDGLSGIYMKRKVDGTLHGDTKLYISTDVLRSYGWDHDDSAYNLLTQKRPPDPVIEEITIDIFRQIPVSVDNYLTKRAFKDEGTFGQFNGVVLAWMSKTKEVYEHTTYTTKMLVAAEAGATAFPDIELATPPTGATGLEPKIWKAQTIFKKIDDYMKEIMEPSRDYNDLGFLRTYKLSDFDIVVPIGVLSDVKKLDVPFLFNPDDKPNLVEVHWKYFGTKQAAGGTTAASNTDVRALVEKVYGTKNYFPGDLLPNSTAYLADETYKADYTTAPTVESDITILMIHKQDFPIMSAFSVGTSFFNAKTLVTNQYLTFGHNEVEDAHLSERALLKVATSNT